MSFSPIEASREIAAKYKRYLNTIFSIEDEHYAKEFRKAIDNEGMFSSGPYLDVTDSFVTGKTLEQLMEEGQIEPGFSSIGIPMDRPLYKHQQIALERIQKGKNLVVSTGTGSGKTECFLIPILNALIAEHRQHKLGPGVRALLIYPMNALANDQVERLRGLLASVPYITYGSYTGQTKNTEKEALADYRALNDGKEPAENELISRDQMKASPPNILITNYAMLEYLMVRPADGVFFDSHFGNDWKFIVLDEAHVYSGSTGIEVSMLLKRLRARLGKDGIQYVLTSATLGDQKDDTDVTRFANNLCSSVFSTEDIVRAYRKKPDLSGDIRNLPKGFYKEIAGLIVNETPDEMIRQRVYEMVHDARREETLSEELYNLVLSDPLYRKMREELSQPQAMSALAWKTGITQEDVADFVTVASNCEYHGARLFDARYHFFLKATDSVFITLKPSAQLFLTRKKVHFEADGTDFKVFEIATCTSCHCLYLTGIIRNDLLEQSSRHETSEGTALFLLNEAVSDMDEDHTLENENTSVEDWEICARCGHVHQKGSKKGCDHGKKYLVPVNRIRVNTPSRVLTKCPHCEGTYTNGILRRFFTGQEAVTSVIGTALFEALPSYKVVKEVAVEGNFGFDFDDDFSEKEHSHREAVAKQFIAFSDNRQGAAYYATYLDQTYHNILYKRIVVEALKTIKETQGISVFTNNIAGIMEKYHISTDDAEREAWKAILAEIADNNGATSLYNLGMIEFGTNVPQYPALRKLGLSNEDVERICGVFLLGMMADAAIAYPYTMSKADKEYFAHGGVEYSYTLSDSNARGYRRSFIPTKEYLTNKRLDYFSRVLKTIGFELSREDTIKYLESFWRLLWKTCDLLKTDGNGAYQVDVSKITVGKPEKVYWCGKCKKITVYNVHGVCPTYMCTGKLEGIDPEKHFKGNHYYELYQELNIRELRVVEHTAQLNKETAYEYQRRFKQKEIDVLSCSTTFEMGVDVGTLETVFMRNMPPSPANYAQRAGRAGRSKKSAAFALTFCNKSNHDFTFFKTPEKMIKGRINPPLFKVENEKIAIRHLYASAFGFFWRKYSAYFSSIGDMVDPGMDGVTGLRCFLDYLNSHPVDLKNYLKSFLPESLSEKFDVEHYGWLSLLWNESEEEPGILTRAISEYSYEVSKLEEAIDTADKYAHTDSLKERVRRFKREGILEFMSRKNVMPKYGFPVDTVEMAIVDRTGKTRLGLQLQRDLAMAISEYAPGSQVVANGNLITSRFIRKVPKLGWKMYDYKRCTECNTLNIGIHVKEYAADEDDELKYCRQCNKELTESPQTFIIPEFGFEADSNKIEKPTLHRPERTYRGDIAYIGYKNRIDLNEYSIGKGLVEVGTSQNDEMAVLNESKFYVCSTCGYTDLDDRCFAHVKKMKHKNASGYPCFNETLRKYSLGYRFKTDVTQIRFLDPEIRGINEAISILYGVLRGVCSYLNIEQSDIAGCIHYFFNPVSNRGNFALIIYDTTPGGAGHVKRIADKDTFQNVLEETLRLMRQCDCGGTVMDTSCYSCLRSYGNQRFHDILERRYVINFLEQLF